MEIHGFQKMTLLDFPGKVACTVFTAGCNLRCPFCHNASLVTQIDNAYRMDESEILDYIKKRKGILDGVVVTGGEPLLYPDTIDFLKRVKEIGMAVKLDHNGTFPERLREAVESGAVDYVAMDVKNSPEKYAMTVGVPEFDLAPIRESISFLLSGKIDFEFRTTAVKNFHTPNDIREIAQWIKGTKKYFLQCFKDSGNLVTTGLEGLTKNEMLELKEAAREIIPETEIRGL